MKQHLSHTVLLLVLLFLFHSSKLSAHPMISKQEQEQVNFNAMTSQDSIVEVDSSSELLMGSEVCETGDEECFKRRLISEAHLDYIYTQHHKP